MNTTSISVSKDTRRRLRTLRNEEDRKYDEIIRDMLDLYDQKKKEKIPV